MEKNDECEGPKVSNQRLTRMSGPLAQISTRLFQRNDLFVRMSSSAPILAAVLSSDTGLGVFPGVALFLSAQKQSAMTEVDEIEAEQMGLAIAGLLLVSLGFNFCFGLFLLASFDRLFLAGPLARKS